MEQFYLTRLFHSVGVRIFFFPDEHKIHSEKHTYKIGTCSALCVTVQQLNKCLFVCLFIYVFTYLLIYCHKPVCGWLTYKPEKHFFFFKLYLNIRHKKY